MVMELGLEGTSKKGSQGSEGSEGSEGITRGRGERRGVRGGGRCVDLAPGGLIRTASLGHDRGFGRNRSSPKASVQLSLALFPCGVTASFLRGSHWLALLLVLAP